MSLKKIAESGSGSVIQYYVYENPDPFENVTDPEHSLFFNFLVSFCTTPTFPFRLSLVGSEAGFRIQNLDPWIQEGQNKLIKEKKVYVLKSWRRLWEMF